MTRELEAFEKCWFSVGGLPTSPSAHAAKGSDDYNLLGERTMKPRGWAKCKHRSELGGLQKQRTVGGQLQSFDLAPNNRNEPIEGNYNPVNSLLSVRYSDVDRPEFTDLG
jgi:hypothetical protein